MSTTIQLAHGGGGELTAAFIRDEICRRFGSTALRGLPDAASLVMTSSRLLFSTDSFVVHPLEFPGGNIGSLAVHGTVNDLAVAGGRPRWLSLGLILEEGTPCDTVRRVLDAVRDAAVDCGVEVVTGDTKVVARGQCDGMYINTAGIAEAIPELSLGPERLRKGDLILTNGPLGDHGMAVMAAREGIEIANGPQSDSAPVHRLVEAVVEHGQAVRFMRDPTRGGAAAVLNEIVKDTQVGIELDETELPVSPNTRAISEMLGLDILNIACEGRLILVCDPHVAPPILAAWRSLPHAENPVIIGRVTADRGRVLLRTVTGGRRLVDLPQGELLPRIC